MKRKARGDDYGPVRNAGNISPAEELGWDGMGWNGMDFGYPLGTSVSEALSALWT